MYIAKVVGTVVSTTKNEGLVGKKLLIIKYLDKNQMLKDDIEVAVDSVGAGFGETVLVTSGSSARNIFAENSPIDRTIVGIIDTIEINS